MTEWIGSLLFAQLSKSGEDEWDAIIKTGCPKSGKYLSRNTGDRSVMRERRRYCYDRTLTDGFRGSAAHKDAIVSFFFPGHRQLFILPYAAFEMPHLIARDRCVPAKRPDLKLNQNCLRHFNSVEVYYLYCAHCQCNLSMQFMNYTDLNF